MSATDLISILLDVRHVPFNLINAPDAVSLKEDWIEQTVPIHSVSNVAVLQDDKGIVIALYPTDHEFRLTQLQTTLHRLVHLIDSKPALEKVKALTHLPDFEPSQEHGVQIIIDEHLSNQDQIHFEAATPCTLYEVEAADLERLANDVLIGATFSEPLTVNKPGIKNTPKVTLKDRISKLDRLPAMPDMPSRILEIRNNPDSTVDDLVAIIKTDIPLSAQIIRYSNSAMFNNNEPVTSLKDSIFRVLGYETVLHLSLGYALGRVFKLPETGPLGREDFWKHATYTAALAQQLATAMPRNIRPKPGIAYLAGLLHDIGFLVINMFSRNEYDWLNKIITANPDASILETEKRLLGTTHSELGAWLMQAWNMPEELIVTVEQHHHLSYIGPHAAYANLMNLTERLLKMHGMSDSETDEIPDELLARLGLTEEDVFEITDGVLQGGETLKEMAVAVSA